MGYSGSVCDYGCDPVRLVLLQSKDASDVIFICVFAIDGHNEFPKRGVWQVAC